MKYEEVTRLGNCFAFRLAGIDDLPGRVGARSSPLHRGLRRKGERGQAELIARPVARRLASAKN